MAHNGSASEMPSNLQLVLMVVSLRTPYGQVTRLVRGFVHNNKDMLMLLIKPTHLITHLWTSTQM